ncbi:hypothetical protein COBT_001519 [Conglomerata obtusa]
MKMILFCTLKMYKSSNDLHAKVYYGNRKSIWSGNYSIFTNISSQTNLYTYLSNECDDRFLFLENINALLFTTISNFVRDIFFSEMSIDESIDFSNKAIIEISQSLQAQRNAILNAIGRHLVYVKERFEEQGDFFFNHAALSMNYITDIYLTRIEAHINKDLSVLIGECGIINTITKNDGIFDQWVRCHLKVFFNIMIYKALEEYKIDVQNLLKHVLQLQIRSNLDKKEKLFDLLDEYRIATINNPLCCFNFNKKNFINSVEIPVIISNINSDLKEVDSDKKYMFETLNTMLNRLNLLCVSCKEFNAHRKVKKNSNNIIKYVKELELNGYKLLESDIYDDFSKKLAIYKNFAPNLVALFSYTKLELIIICSCRLIDVFISNINRTIHEIIDNKSESSIVCLLTSLKFGPLTSIKLYNDIESLKSILKNVTEICKSTVVILIDEVKLGYKIIQSFNQNNNDLAEKTIVANLYIFNNFIKNDIFELCITFQEHAYFDPFKFLQCHDEYTSAKYSMHCENILMSTLKIEKNKFTNKYIPINDNMFSDFSARYLFNLDKLRVTVRIFIKNLNDEKLKLTNLYWNHAISVFMSFVKKLKKNFYKLYYSDVGKNDVYYLSLTKYLYNNHAMYNQTQEKRENIEKNCYSKNIILIDQTGALFV